MPILEALFSLEGNDLNEAHYCCDYQAGVRSCYDEGKRTAETLAMDYHRGADVQVLFLVLYCNLIVNI